MQRQVLGRWDRDIPFRRCYLLSQAVERFEET